MLLLHRKLFLLSCLFIFALSNITFGEEIKNEDTESRGVKLDGLTEDEMRDMRAKAEKHEFQAEVDRMMKLIINSLYKNKDIFLRELISNSADALDKIRFISLTDPKALQAGDELEIKIKANETDRTLSILDTGVGMTKDELVKNLGTIAKSGTSDFLAKVAETNSDASTVGDLIGQFGVGFYSSFLVADKVTVISKPYNGDQYIWESDAKSFSVNKDPRGNTLTRGTEIILHLKPESKDLTHKDALKNLIKKYSQFINFPIYVWSSQVEMVDKPEEPSTEKTDSEKTDATVEEEKKPAKVEQTVWDWELVNKNKPIWLRKPSNVTNEEYNDFYKALVKSDSSPPIAKIHFNAEGEVGFKSILYIPEHTADVYNNNALLDGIKLYVRRVFITDTFSELLPRYLNFLRGIIDSDDLPLNVSRENLQESKLSKIIKKKVVRKAIEMISKIPEDQYTTFWSTYGTAIKMGVNDDSANKARLAKLLRFHTSLNETGLVSLNDYVNRMPTTQKDIYVCTAPSVEIAKNLPFVERFLKRSLEVVYMIDPIDEYILYHMHEFEGKKIKNLAKEGVEISQSTAAKQAKEAQQKEFSTLLTWFKETAFKDTIKDAVLSDILTESPCALLAGEYDRTGNMMRIMEAQALQDTAMSNYNNAAKKTFGINPRHPLIKELKARVDADPTDERTIETAKLLYDSATLRSGFSIPDSVDFAKRIETVMRKSLDVDLFATADEIPNDEPADEDSTENLTDGETDKSSEEDSPVPEVDKPTIVNDASSKDEL